MNAASSRDGDAARRQTLRSPHRPLPCRACDNARKDDGAKYHARRFEACEPSHLSRLAHHYSVACEQMRPGCGGLAFPIELHLLIHRDFCHDGPGSVEGNAAESLSRHIGYLMFCATLYMGRYVQSRIIQSCAHGLLLVKNSSCFPERPGATHWQMMAPALNATPEYHSEEARLTISPHG